MADKPASKRASLLRGLESTRAEWLARYAATGQLPSLDGVELVQKVSTSGVGDWPFGLSFDRFCFSFLLVVLLVILVLLPFLLPFLLLFLLPFLLPFLHLFLPLFLSFASPAFFVVSLWGASRGVCSFAVGLPVERPMEDIGDPCGCAAAQSE
jgi:hypothetical protein